MARPQLCNACQAFGVQAGCYNRCPEIQAAYDAGTQSRESDATARALRTGLQLALDLSSGASDEDILSAAARARTSELAGANKPKGGDVGMARDALKEARRSNLSVGGDGRSGSAMGAVQVDLCDPATARPEPSARVKDQDALSADATARRLLRELVESYEAYVGSTYEAFDANDERHGNALTAARALLSGSAEPPGRTAELLESSSRPLDDFRDWEESIGAMEDAEREALAKMLRRAEPGQ